MPASLAVSHPHRPPNHRYVRRLQGQRLRDTQASPPHDRHERLVAKASPRPPARLHERVSLSAVSTSGGNLRPLFDDLAVQSVAS